MKYLPGKNFSFFIVINFLFIALLHLPVMATGTDIFSESSTTKSDIIVDLDRLPVGTTGSNRGTSVDDNQLTMGRRTNHYSPSRLGKKRVRFKASNNNIKEGKNQSDQKSVTYSGRAEADGRSATLELHFDGNNVSGRLQAKGVSEKYIRLPSTDVTFTPVPLNGAWEADDTTIFAPWKGGDYIGGVLIPDYPTRGNLSIKLTERNGKKVVYLHRIDSSSYGYVFPLKGVVYTPPDAGNSDGTATGNGYWDPVGSWSGEKFNFLLKAVVEKSGDVTVTISCENETPEYRKGKWHRQGNGIKVKWSAATMQEHEHEEPTIYAFFNGANCLVVDEEDGDYTKLYRDSEISSGDNFPKQTIFSAESDVNIYGSLGPPNKTYKMPNFSNSNYRGVVTMNWMESRIFVMNPRNDGLIYIGNYGHGDVISIKRSSLDGVFVTSGLKYVQTGNRVNVTAEKEGQQQVWLSYKIKCSGKDSTSGERSEIEGNINYSWLVLVGKDEFKKWEGKKQDSPQPNQVDQIKPDIASFTISGIVKEMGSFQCVEGAIVELLPKSSNQVCRTDKNGRFKYTFTNLHSGRKELFVRKPYGLDGLSLSPLESVDQDLWPIKKYMFVLDTEKDGTGIIITDVIWMKKIRFIGSRHEKDLSFKLQKK